MKNFVFLLCLSLTLLSWQVRAQVTPASQTDENSTSSVSTFLAQAKLDLEEINEKLNALSKKTTSFASSDTCSFIELNFQKDYALWFIDHEKQFRDLESEYQNHYQSLENHLLQKMETLKSKPIPAVPVEGQTSAVTINLDSAIHYLNDFNARYRNQTEATLSDFFQLQESPQMNPPFYLAHSQILKSLELMTTELNSALKQESDQYRINFRMTKIGGQLAIQEFDNKNKLLYSLSLLKEAESKTLVNFWSFLSASEHREVDQFPLAGIERIWAMQEKNKSYCLSLGKLPYFMLLPQDEMPYVSLVHLKELLSHGERKLTNTKATALAETTIESNAGSSDLMIPVYSYYSNYSDHLYTTSTKSVLGYNKEIIRFYVAKSPVKPFTQAVYRCFVKINHLHFLSTDRNCENTSDTSGYQNEGILGYVSKNKSSESPRAIFRCSYDMDHFETLSSAECRQSGYTNEGVLGYTSK